jgi:Asp-tRNA(Asn)/Glu-tRNA(Gln) amidotransferase C subunit
MIDLSILPEGMRELVGDYPVHLLHMRSIPDEDLEKMNSDLKYVLGMLKCSRSKKKYQAFIHNNHEYFSRIPKSAADVLDVFMNIGDLREYFQYTNNLDEHGEETTDMCKALNDIVKDAKKEGEERGKKLGEEIGEERGKKLGEEIGKKLGEEIGKKLGEEIGEERGKATTTLLSITNLMKNLQLTMEQAMDALEVPQNQRAKYKQLLRI